MKIRSIFYHLKQGFKNIYRNRLFSLASIATITACVFLFGVFYSIMMNFEYMVKKAENEVCVTVFFDEGLSDTEIKKLGDTISNRVEVSSVHYTSAEEAWNNFKSEYFAAYPDLAEGFKDNPLINSASYEVYLMRECRERWLHILKIWTACVRSTVPKQQRAVCQVRQSWLDMWQLQ